jgi:hypothetical protein
MGLRRAVEMDTAAMDGRQAAAVEALVAEANFFALPDVVAGDQPGADLFEYRIEIELNPGAEHAVVFHDPVVPPQARPLLDYLLAACTAAK